MDFLLCELRIRRDYTLRLRECDIFSISPEFAGCKRETAARRASFLQQTVERLNLFQGAVFMKSSYNGKAIPSDGKPIGYSGGELRVPDTPIIPFIEGDGTGRDIWKASRRVFDAAVEQAYGGKRRVAWFEVFAGEKAFNTFKEWLPNDTVEAIRDFRVAIKGPLTTPVGGGIRSLNVALRQILDLYSCERPVRYFT